MSDGYLLLKQAVERLLLFDFYSFFLYIFDLSLDSPFHSHYNSFSLIHNFYILKFVLWIRWYRTLSFNAFLKFQLTRIFNYDKKKLHLFFKIRYLKSLLSLFFIKRHNIFKKIFYLTNSLNVTNVNFRYRFLNVYRYFRFSKPKPFPLLLDGQEIFSIGGWLRREFFSAIYFSKLITINFKGRLLFKLFLIISNKNILPKKNFLLNLRPF